jgi:hypothetical protein
MFTWLRSRIRFAGRIGWIDGRRGYPNEDQYVELQLHRPEGPSGLTEADEAEPALARSALSEAAGMRSAPAGRS